MSAAAELADLYPDEQGPGERKFAVADEAPFTTSTPYWEEKVRVCKIVASHPEGAVLNHIVAELHGRDQVESGGAEYQRVRRFTSSNPSFFRVSRSNGLVFVQPQLALLDLINGGIIQNHQEEPSTGDFQFCQQVLRTVTEINEKGRNILEYNLREYVERINDLRLVLHSEEADPEYLTLPYKTRFNDQGRISKQWSITSRCLEKAGEEYNNAVLLTLTTDPKKFDSLYEMTAGDATSDRPGGINHNWNRLMSWLSSDTHLGYRPDYVKVLEFTEKGYPHLHAIVFLEDESTTASGMPWLESKNAISNYWNKYQARIVDMQPLTWQDDLGDEYEANEGWVRWRKDGNHGGLIEEDDDEAESALEEKSRRGQTAGQYLGKYLSAVYGGIRELGNDSSESFDAGEHVEGKHEEKAATWKLAMYWATGRKIRTESRDLRQAVEEEMDEDDNEERAKTAEIIRDCRYEFVGAYSYDEIPSHIRGRSAPVDAIMNAMDDPPDNSGKVVGRIPARARPLLLPDLLEGSGMLFGDRDEPDQGDDLAEYSGDPDDGANAAEFM